MPAEVSFVRSNYDPRLDVSATHDDYTSREKLTVVGTGSGRLINFNRGELDNDTTFNDGTVIPVNERSALGDVASPTRYAEFPLKPDAASIEIWLRLLFSGAFSSVTNLRMVMSRSDLTGYGTGSYINAYRTVTFPNGAPGTGRNQFGYSGPLFFKPDHPGNNPAIPSPIQQSQNFNQGYLDLMPGASIVVGGYSQYAVLQLVTGSSPTPGLGGACEFSFQFDES